MVIELNFEPWVSDAVCASVDSELFFPEKGGSTRDAKRICNTACPVREQCLQYALDHHIREGIWGGMSERERRAVAKDAQRPTHDPVCTVDDCNDKHHAGGLCHTHYQRARRAA